MAKKSYLKGYFNQENPKHLQNNIFMIYSPRVIKLEPATSIKTQTSLCFYHKNQKDLLLPRL